MSKFKADISQHRLMRNVGIAIIALMIFAACKSAYYTFAGTLENDWTWQQLAVLVVLQIIVFTIVSYFAFEFGCMVKGHHEKLKELLKKEMESK